MPTNRTTTPKICSVDGCERPARNLGLCVKHYNRFRVHGDVNYRQWDAVTPEMRFWRKVKKSDDPNDCWSWTGSTSPLGYGQMGLNGKLVLTHRFSYELHKGPIPDGLHLDHLCRNPNCCNPDHLEAVTQAENIRRGNGWSGRNARKTHCPRGHELTDHNVRIRVIKNSICRECLTCHKERDHRRRKASEAA